MLFKDEYFLKMDANKSWLVKIIQKAGENKKRF